MIVTSLLRLLLLHYYYIIITIITLAIILCYHKFIIMHTAWLLPKTKTDENYPFSRFVFFCIQKKLKLPIVN